MGISEITVNAQKQFNDLFGNMFKFEESDMTAYDACYAEVFKKGINFSYMASTFYAQFAAELFVGMLASNPFRKYLVQALDDEKICTDFTFWEESMNQNRFGIPDRDYKQDKMDIMIMMNDTYTKISELNKWFGTADGRKEFDMYCLSRKAIRDIKRIVCEFPYLIRKYDHDETFAKEIMEYAGIVEKKIIQTAGKEK